jgi:formylmethanofuran dehydrogenase subunit E
MGKDCDWCGEPAGSFVRTAQGEMICTQCFESMNDDWEYDDKPIEIAKDK